MIKSLIACFLLGISCFSMVYADADALCVLRHRLKQISNNIYAHVIQEINDADGKVIVVSRGKLWVKRPNLFHWHIIDPEENFLISDSKTIWFYVPLIKQVTAYSVKNNISNNIFLKLLSNCEVFHGNDYDVNQEQDLFYLKPIISGRDNLKSYEIKISDFGRVDQFSIIENNGICINYYLHNQNNKLIDITKFEFIIPTDVQLDDQRNNL